MKFFSEKFHAKDIIVKKTVVRFKSLLSSSKNIILTIYLFLGQTETINLLIFFLTSSNFYFCLIVMLTTSKQITFW
jgi:hypothetical protein